MFINALTFNINTLKEVSDKELIALKEYFYRTQVQMMNIRDEILKDIMSHEGWRENQTFINILKGLDGSFARRNEYLPMFGIAGDREDYIKLWHLAEAEEERRREESRNNNFNNSNETKIWTVISIEEDYSPEDYSSRVWVTTSVIGVFTSEEAAEKAAANALGETHIIRGHLNKSVIFDDPIEKTYGHTE